MVDKTKEEDRQEFAEQVASILKSKGGNEVPDFCPDCFKKDLQLERATTLAKVAETEHQVELEKAAALADQFKEQLEEAQAKPEAHDIPDFADILEHCETCPGHKKQLEDYRGTVANDVLTNLSTKEFKSKLLEVMAKAGVKPAPSKIVISGLKR